MLEVLGIVVFAAMIAASIALHELGHLVPAKRFGVRVTQYMVGFGPTIWSRQRGETEYGVKAIPLGGYIRMIGMLPPGTRAAQGRFATMVEDARRQAQEEIRPEDESRLFYRLPVRKRIIIMVGGPLMNLLIALALFAVVLVGIGLPEPTARVGAIVPCVPTMTQPTGATLPSGECPVDTPVSPAQAAGLVAGDTITTVDGVSVAAWADVTSIVRERGGQQVDLGIVRDGVPTQVTVAVATVERPVVDERGQPTGAVDEAGFVGIRPEFTYVRQPWSAVPVFAWDLTVRSVEALISLPIRLVELVNETLIQGGERPVDSPVSVVGASRLGGEIAALDEPVSGRVATFLGLVASLNLFLFLFNLLPILPLDGGHVAGALYEGVRRWWAKVRGRPDPGPADVARLLPVAYVVAAILVGMGAIVIWADLVRPISLG